MGASNSKPKTKPTREESGSGGNNPSNDQTPLIANPVPAAPSPTPLNEAEGSRQRALKFDELGKKETRLKPTPTPGPKMQETMKGIVCTTGSRAFTNGH